VSSPSDWAVADGWFWAVRPPAPGVSEVPGYRVTDADGIGFWAKYQRLGGAEVLGYPRSRRFAQDDAVMQVLQRAVLRSIPTDADITAFPLPDWLHDEGHDSQLADDWAIPPLTVPVPDDASAEIYAQRLDWVFAEFPSFRAYLSGVPDAAELLGWPTSPVHDAGAFYVVRFQTGALQQWKEDVSWAKRGDFPAVNVGELAVALSVFPPEALVPERLPPPRARRTE
jgi:hypothetical protein